jgi:hypothetical protein
LFPILCGPGAVLAAGSITGQLFSFLGVAGSNPGVFVAIEAILAAIQLLVLLALSSDGTNWTSRVPGALAAMCFTAAIGAGEAVAFLFYALGSSGAWR